MILDGKKLSRQILYNVGKNIKKYNLRPALAVILIGENPGSIVYVRLKQKAAQHIGIKFQKYQFSDTAEQEKITNIIKQLNKNKNIHGIIVQLPLPKHLDPDFIIKTIAPEKDVDGFQDKSHFLSPAHQGVIRLLKQTKQSLKGKKAVIINKNPVFYNPLILLLEQQGIESSCQVKPDMGFKQADIIITALGKPYCIKPEMIKKNAIVIDIGYSRVKGSPQGDVDPSVRKKSNYVSPVPGGVGPLTVAYLLKNIYLSAKRMPLPR